MALQWEGTSSRIVDAKETSIAPRPTNTNPLKNKLIHANIQVSSIEDITDPNAQYSLNDDSIEPNSPSADDVVYKQRAAEMQMWWDEAIAKNMNLPDGYSKVSVLLIKWTFDLDELQTEKEVEELDDVFRNVYHFDTETVELNVKSKPQHQLNRHISEFIENHDGPHNLLIVYYTGHGQYREDSKFLELTASINPIKGKGLSKDARANWNKAEEKLRADEVEGDVLTILDTCYSSNLVKSGNQDTRKFELLSACGFDQTTAAPGNLSFTRALIDALKDLANVYVDRPFSTFRLNQCILQDKRRHDTPSALWFRLSNEQHILLAPLRPEKEHARQKAGLLHTPRGFLTLRFALRDESLDREQIESLTKNLSKAFNTKSLNGKGLIRLRRIDWLGIKPASITHFERVALVMFVITQWKKVVLKRREQKGTQEGVGMEIKTAKPPPTRKRTREDVSDDTNPKRQLLRIDQPPSPPVSTSSRVHDED
ncbi:hypothetical protein P153DRAFT_366394 [Dothidotthia symphoricarpi CBS 119687]|uniref:Peptidase C14 caspase domain-containing protein n=1 Tax=Dothidotthia symphoricarpi CBS 119687 TaxID=1392245 RepID=A0A6A6ADN9_9PLEO|nr:uncharacterized protein P153DRAFT_366394 [Dothidotthia symphoricarpi CBS 119687]KAF2129890.1 hypothetical protein P153DRAFT_366394 [Dothidotthia symphoricarpi CBS 119687]